MKNWLKDNLINILVACLIGIPLSLYAISQQPKQVIVEPEEIIEYQDPETEIGEESVEVSVESLDCDEGAETSNEVIFYDVPLSEELQLHIFEECEKHNIAPAIVIAIIERESDFNTDKVGDNGKSFGLMQIQKHYHLKRMERLECTDLFDPFQNVTVGIDYLAELKNEDADLYWVLMAYNGGRGYADKRIESLTFSDYAIEVTSRASDLGQVAQDD